MQEMNKRLTQQELHSLFLHDVDGYAEDIVDTGHKPLELRISYPINQNVKVYLYNCTSPPGGRSIDEYKVQLILDGQKRGQRGQFDDSNGITNLIVGYACPFLDIHSGIWVLFELDKHREFAYSANIQIYLRQILKALENEVYTYQKHNKETVVLCKRQHLMDALKKRFDIDLQIMIGKQNEIEGL